MQLGDCQISRCDQPAIWTVDTEGHLNVDGTMHEEFCADHVRMATWDGSPFPMTITIRGPFKPEHA